MIRLSSSGMGAPVTMTEAQYEAGRAVAAGYETKGRIFAALKDAGVPVRSLGAYPASVAATMLALPATLSVERI